jgi:hypothetical protein
MKEKISIKKYISFALWITLLIWAVFFPKFFDYTWWSVIVSAFPFILKLAYDHFDWITLLVNRTFLWLLNEKVSWELKVRYRGKQKGDVFDSIIKTIRKNTEVKTIQSNEFEKTIGIEEYGMVIKIFIASTRTDEDDFSEELIFSTQRMIVPFRHSSETLHKLISLLDEIKKVIRFESEQYDFKAIFTDNNPYLGLFLRRLKLNEAATVNVNYGENVGATKAKVSVNKNKVVLITTDLYSLQSFSKKYITLSSLNLSDSS